MPPGTFLTPPAAAAQYGGWVGQGCLRPPASLGRMTENWLHGTSPSHQSLVAPTQALGWLGCSHTRAGNVKSTTLYEGSLSARTHGR
jgi:hypothetical protein